MLYTRSVILLEVSPPARPPISEVYAGNYDGEHYTYTIPGRRWGMFIGGLIIIVGTCVQASSKDLAAFMVGRFILGFGVAISASAGPAYVSEMAHPSYRGVMTGL